MTMYSWQPSKYLEDPQEYRQKYVSEATGQGRFALIVLNQPILIQRHLLDNVWNNAAFRFCADGGANQLYDLLETDDERAKFLPDSIRGDLDSLRDSVREFYLSKKVPVERVDDQDSTDFMKCVELVRARDSQPVSTTLTRSLEQINLERQQQQLATNLSIVALGGTGGRFDHSMSNIHHLYVLNRERHATLISDESIIIVLAAGKHEITCNLDIEGPSCGIIPVGSSEAILTTDWTQVGRPELEDFLWISDQYIQCSDGDPCHDRDQCSNGVDYGAQATLKLTDRYDLYNRVHLCWVHIELLDFSIYTHVKNFATSKSRGFC